MNRTRLRLGGLVIVHIAATMALGQSKDNGLTAFLSGCLLFSQIGLLAIGLIFGTWRLRWRVGSFLAGTAALVWWDWHSQANFQTNFFGSLDWIVLPELSVAAGLLVVRYGPPKLRLIQLGETVFSSTRFQFSLRQVMVLVVVIAVTLSAAKPIHAYVSAFAAHLADLQTVFLISALLSGVVVSWVTTWVTLSVAGLWVKSTLVLVLALALGLLKAYCFAPLFPLNDENWYKMPMSPVGQSLFTMASLLVVRSCGLRLIGRKEMATLAVTT